uniref:Uncharacterized protein n=1 Tax=Salix viminalis TaxID=40686 RepID=A0A6N2LL51_SALVM
MSTAMLSALDTAQANDLLFLQVFTLFLIVSRHSLLSFQSFCTALSNLPIADDAVWKSVELDNIPMLSDTHPKSEDEIVDSRFHPFLSRTQSASTSIRLDSMESYGSETNLVGFTGPLRSARKAPLVQMVDQLYINRNTENLLLANHGVRARKTVEHKPERYPSLSGMDQNDWAHLMRSRQLGCA